MKKNKWVLLLIAFVAFLVLVYFIGACLNATAEALTIISLCIGILVIYLVVKAIKSKWVQLGLSTLFLIVAVVLAIQ